MCVLRVCSYTKREKKKIKNYFIKQRFDIVQPLVKKFDRVSVCINRVEGETTTVVNKRSSSS